MKLIISTLLLIAAAALTGCGVVLPSKCTSNDCVVAITTTNGHIALQGSNAPTYPPYPPEPVAAEKRCVNMGGDWYKTNPHNSFAYYRGGKWNMVYVCENLPYIGSDGGSYYYSPVDITYGQLSIIQDPQAASASYQECMSGNYPGTTVTEPSGIWVNGYDYCRPQPGN